MESTRSCWPSWRANSRSVVASASVVTVISLPTTQEWRPSQALRPGAPAELIDKSIGLWESPLPAGQRGRERSVSWRSHPARRQLLHLGHHAVEDLQARIPEPRIGDVHAQPPDELVRPGGTARREEFEVVLDEARPDLEVAVVNG